MSLREEVRDIVDLCGSAREKSILSQPNMMEPDPDTWNEEHRVVNISTLEIPGEYQYEFAVDLVTKSICG